MCRNTKPGRLILCIIGLAPQIYEYQAIESRINPTGMKAGRAKGRLL